MNEEKRWWENVLFTRGVDYFSPSLVLGIEEIIFEARSRTIDEAIRTVEGMTHPLATPKHEWPKGYQAGVIGALLRLRALKDKPKEEK